MKSAKLLQLGDIHFPDHKDLRLGDIKDTGAPAALVSAIGPNRLQTVMKKACQVIEEQHIQGLLICGDLTSYGDLAQYSACVDYLQSALDVANPDRWNPDAIHVVPGNHDVDRKNCDPAGIDLFHKFDPLIASWKRIGLNILAARSVRSTEIKPNGHSLCVFSLNSCIGCGEHRHLPAKLRAEIINAMEKYSAVALTKDSFELIYEQLDTPAFADIHLDELVNALTAASSSALPIVLAHHNALPQSIPRVEIYTELLNSGRFRSRLASCRRPLVYCHGHIHDDPIEQLVDHRFPGGFVLFVSAPLIIEGFNILEIAFARNDLPVGCTITKFRTSNSLGTIDQTETVNVSLVPKSLLPRFDDDKLRGLLKVCSPEAIRFGELRTKLNSHLSQNLQAATVRDLVVEAEWLSLVQILDRNQPHLHWKVRRGEP